MDVIVISSALQAGSITANSSRQTFLAPRTLELQPTLTLLNLIFALIPTGKGSDGSGD